MENKHSYSDLAQMQSLSLESKIRMSLYRIQQWYEAFEGNVYISFSGGKDSTVLLDLVRSLYPEVPAVFPTPVSNIRRLEILLEHSTMLPLFVRK